MQPTTKQAGPPPGEWTRVIALAGPVVESTSDLAADGSASTNIAPISAPLAEEFQHRDWFAIVAHDPYQALAELALRERAQAARTAWGLQRMEGLALVVIEPTRWPQAMLDDLFAAVRRWLPPSVTIWLAVNDRIEQAASDVSGAASVQSPAVSPAVLNMNALIAALPREQPLSTHANGIDRAAIAAPSASRSTTAAAPERLSREEIDMLLREDIAIDSENDASTPEGGA